MTIKWEKIKDPDDGMNEYKATVNGIEFYIYQSTDAGFGLTAYRNGVSLQLRWGICWYRTLRRCKEQAELILARETSPEMAGVERS